MGSGGAGQGLEVARKAALEFLEQFKEEVKEGDREVLRWVARTSLRTKLYEALADQLADIVVDALLLIRRPGEPVDLFMVCFSPPPLFPPPPPAPPHPPLVLLPSCLFVPSPVRSFCQPFLLVSFISRSCLSLLLVHTFLPPSRPFQFMDTFVPFLRFSWLPCGSLGFCAASNEALSFSTPTFSNPSLSSFHSQTPVQPLPTSIASGGPSSQTALKHRRALPILASAHVNFRHCYGDNRRRTRIHSAGRMRCAAQAGRASCLADPGSLWPFARS